MDTAPRHPEVTEVCAWARKLKQKQAFWFRTDISTKPTELHKLTYVLKCREVAEAMCVWLQINESMTFVLSGYSWTKTNSVPNMQQQRSVQTKDKDQISDKTNSSFLAVSPPGSCWKKQACHRSDTGSLTGTWWV